MSKKSKQSMAEDYLAQVEWDNNHPLDRRGRPSWIYQPKWKYKRVYRIGGDRVSPVIQIIWIVAVIATIGFLVYQILVTHSGSGFFGSIAILFMLTVFYFLTRPPK